MRRKDKNMNRRPIIFQVNSSCNKGSTGRIAEMIGRTAKERGYDCYMAYGRYYQPSELKVIKMGNNLTNNTHAVLSRIFDNHGLLSSCPTYSLIEQIKQIKPDIVHLHNIHGYFLNYRILFEYLKTTKTPIIWTLHDCWSFTGHCCYFDVVGCEKWKTGCEKCPGLLNYPKSLLFDRSIQNYQLKKDLFTAVADRMTLIPVSDWLAGFVKESFLKDATIHTIHNGVDTAIFKYTNEPYIKIPNGKKLVLGVAAIWDYRKGLDDIIKLSRILDEDYQIVVVGLTHRQIENLPPNIIGIEHTESLQELVQLYSSASVFINPTREDNFPTTNIEALSCGTPVITYRTGGSIEAVTPDTGSIIEQGDIEELNRQIIRISKQDRDTWRKACRKRAVEHFEMRDRYTEYVDIYDNYLNR